MVLSVSTHSLHSEQKHLPRHHPAGFFLGSRNACVCVWWGKVWEHWRRAKNTKVCCKKDNQLGLRHCPVPKDVLLHQEPPFSGLQRSSKMFHVWMHIRLSIYTGRDHQQLSALAPPISTHLVLSTAALGSSALTALIPPLSPELCQTRSDPSPFG